MIYIALLRAINVGGHKKVKMADLKQLLQSIGLRHVKTYIQSGNVLFESDEDMVLLRERIEREFSGKFGFTSTIVLRTAEEFDTIITNCPYDFEKLLEVESIHIAFLTEEPPSDGIEHVRSFNSDAEECQFNGKNAYLLFREGVRNSKLAVQFQKIGVPVTMRNMKTVHKLASMVKTIQD
ncbi:DUF1697 domain-containing protein [Alkalihalobacillus sp. AL-G]|uniref:DUF1697 domain-containing protein n=1 Tax=Alkalihalobacillus sp. AL-G TaxID=2926399 RepID=UPI00272A503B|nr:DUF1697 domain-containing protein [Alkalihalobacillus sp. AL-G]WLD92555.1 DUF1697 domain-containing protein [Alkalihalobacillus sp. AL-G]